jgi:hypothetical protein
VFLELPSRRVDFEKKLTEVNRREQIIQSVTLQKQVQGRERPQGDAAHI